MDDWLERFVNTENISRFADGFGREVDPTRRHVLKELLITEERRLGTRSWQLEVVEKNLSRVNSHIERQQSMIADGRMGDLELKQANLLLDNYSELVRLLEEFRSFVVQGLDQGKI